jgi:hypothetical protein
MARRRLGLPLKIEQIRLLGVLSVYVEANLAPLHKAA